MSEHVSVTTLLCNPPSCVRTEASSDKLRPVRVSGRRNAALYCESSTGQAADTFMIPHSSLIIKIQLSVIVGEVPFFELIIEDWSIINMESGSDRLIPSDLVKTEIKDPGEDETDCVPANHRSGFLHDTFRTTNQGQATGYNPTIESWPGPRNFQIEIEDFGNWKKRGYTFSRDLNKLFIEMGKPVAVRFNIDPSLSSDPEDEASLIRALPVYVDISYRASPVVR